MPATTKTIKDYYRILQVKKSSSDEDIKKSYRLLAFKYHPDKNPCDEIAAAVFTEINEAYEILNDKEKRDTYNESLYYYAPQEIAKPLESIDTLIAKSLNLKKIIETSNPFHVNKDALEWSIKELLPDYLFTILQNDFTNQKEKLLLNIIDCCGMLRFHQTKELSVLLFKLAGKNMSANAAVQSMLLSKKRNENWEKNKIWLASVIAIALCLFIYFITQKK